MVSAVGLLSAAMMAPSLLGWALPAFAALLLWAILQERFAAIHVTLFALLWAATAAFFPGSRVWPTKLLAPLGIYAVTVALLGALRGSIRWFRAGRLDRRAWQGIAVTVAISSAALVAWVTLTEPNLGVHLANMPEIPPWTYPLAALVFAVLNAALEEVIFRGIVMQALDDALGAGPWAIVLQAVCFGAAHYLAGFPNGALGLAMTIAYGVMLGVIRRRSGGLLAPWIAHVAADLTVFAILAAVKL